MLYLLLPRWAHILQFVALKLDPRVSPHFLIGRREFTHKISLVACPVSENILVLRSVPVEELLDVDRALEPRWYKRVEGGWLVRMILDTGACTSVHPNQGIPGIPMYKNEHTGKELVAANQTTMEHAGEMGLHARDYATRNTNMRMKSQGTDVNNFLGSGIDIVDGDNWIVVHKKGGYV